MTKHPGLLHSLKFQITQWQSAAVPVQNYISIHAQTAKWLRTAFAKCAVLLCFMQMLHYKSIAHVLGVTCQ